MAPNKSRTNLKRNATNATTPSSSKKQRRGAKQSSEDQTHLTSSPSSSSMKLDRVPPRREPRQAALAANKKAQKVVNRKEESGTDEDEDEDEDDRDFESQNNGTETTTDHDESEEQDSEDDFEDDFRTKKRRTTSVSTPKKRSSTSASKITLSTKSTKNSTSDKKKQEPKSMTTSQQAALDKAMSQFKVSKVKIPRPKGGPFADAIQPETLEFIRDLKLNNDREYMMLNQERCDKAKADFMDFIRMLKDGLRELDPDVMDQEPKDAMMRIYRDVRFSNDKSPYKSQLSAHFSRGGKKSIAAGYFFSVSSENESFIGCGVWDPSSAVLSRIRNGIVEEEERFRDILASDALAAVKQGKRGIELLQHRNMLKTGPKGFDKDHSAIEFLKLKNFAIGRHFTDLEVVSPGFLDEVLRTYDACVDFVHILNEWIG